MQMLNLEEKKKPSRTQSLAYVIECLFEMADVFRLNIVKFVELRPRQAAAV